MEFDLDNVRQMVEEDRLSSLPDELIHKILSCLNMKYVVQTCVLSSRWEFLWTSMPNLNFSSGHFISLHKFSKFVTNVLSHRNHQIEVSSVKLDFDGAASQAFVRKIANYMFSHNVQQLTVTTGWPKRQKEFPPCLFSSQSLKHFTLSSSVFSPCITPKTPWNFPALTSLHLSNITLSDDDTEKSLDIFSKCVNLKNLTIKNFFAQSGGVFDIITPRLSNLTLIDSFCRKAINLSAPQLENLTVIKCRIKYLNAPLRLSSLYYRGYDPIQLPKDRFHSLDKVSICLNYCCSEFKEEDARKTINMLQVLHSSKYLTLNWDIIECISSFSDLLSQHPSPFSNLICLTVDPSERKNAYRVKMSTEARNFFLVSSPDAIMELPEEPPTKAMKQKEARAKKKAKQAAEIESHMKELETLINEEKLVVERKVAKEKANAALKNLMAELPLLSLQKIKLSLEKMKMEDFQGKVLMDSDNTAMQVQQEHTTETERLMAQFKICVGEMRALVKDEKEEAIAILAKEDVIRSLLENLPKRERTQVEAHYSRPLEETKAHYARLLSQIVSSETIFACERLLSDDDISIYQHVSSSKLPLPPQGQSSSSTMGC